MSLNEFIDGCLNALTWAGVITGEQRLNRHLLRTDIDGSVGVDSLRSDVTNFRNTYRVAISNAPGIPGLTLADGTPASLDWQAGHDYCLIRVGRWSAFPATAWGAALAASMTATALAQPRLTISVAEDGTITIVGV